MEYNKECTKNVLTYRYLSWIVGKEPALISEMELEVRSRVSKETNGWSSCMNRSEIRLWTLNYKDKVLALQLQKEKADFHISVLLIYLNLPPGREFSYIQQLIMKLLLSVKNWMKVGMGGFQKRSENRAPGRNLLAGE